MNILTIHVIGTPAPQGSKRAFVVNGKAVLAESSKKVKPWRQDVKSAVEDLASDGLVRSLEQLPLTGPLEVSIDFYLPRPGYHFRTGKHAGELKDNAPAYVDKKPDVDKLLRSTLDGLKEAGVYRDDAQVAIATGVKHYANAATGARIAVRPLIASPAADSPAAAGEVLNQRQEVLFP
ncbi:RusA family crossover junction endodeoxyribonuclease [Nocardioides sp. SYSU D00065]|uniref:RusA family crossover junction endodeoxyribonuclease n=1 Tax=Nocardioides sp. SYSU D00065 TaxID=2817378 RepID=UPI001B328330|nr:RusA family crossover junction endodeoxyribonuclease [Nocardioides sp. SYSU D00065]